MPSQFVGADDTTTVLWGGAHLACRPCYDGREFANCRDNQCMSSIAVEVVLATARALILEMGASPSQLRKSAGRDDSQWTHPEPKVIVRS